ncbi:MAG TPA: mucoidy inhibitor MuiA family protein [Ohtaekwangia sp.]|nr:mucoidy inhibitor MuiA family protein [Ohtaekwangia sp.]
MRTATFICFLLSVTTFAQGPKERELKTTINEVTVFLDGAQIFETGSVSIPIGKNKIRIKNLSPYIDEKSVQVKATGDFTILSVNHRHNYISALKKDQSLDSLRQAKETLQAKIAEELSRLDVLKEKLNLMNENRNLGGINNGATLTQLKQAMDFYDAEITKIKQEEIRINNQIKIYGEREQSIDQQLKEENDRKVLPTGEIEILVSAAQTVTGKFSVSYLVANAGWFPKYDVRVQDINSPLQLTYKAEVFQNTGVDWKNVKLRFSNGTPNQSGLIPELRQWNLSYARNTIYDKSTYALASRVQGTVKGRVFDDAGNPVPGVNVIVKGTTLGTVTDANGNYSLTLPRDGSVLVFSFIGYATQEREANSAYMDVNLNMDVAQLNEVVVTGYASAQRLSIRGVRSVVPEAKQIVTTFVENQTTVEIEVAEPYSIKSDGEKLLVDLKLYDIPASYEYYAVPKLDKDAFLVAQIVDWDQYSLLEGEANLYFEDAFIGRSILNAKSLTDTLKISLGRDKSIVIDRAKIDEFSKTKTIGTNKTDTRGFKITVRNRKSQPIRLNLYDQLPVSVVSDITITPETLSGAQLEPTTGKVSWTFTVEPQKQKEVILKYEVKYPRRENVVLE